MHIDVVFSIVGFPRDVKEVILGDDGVLAGMKPGGTIVDMTTSEASSVDTWSRTIDVLSPSPSSLL